MIMLESLVGWARPTIFDFSCRVGFSLGGETWWAVPTLQGWDWPGGFVRSNGLVRAPSLRAALGGGGGVRFLPKRLPTELNERLPGDGIRRPEVDDVSE